MPALALLPAAGRRKVKKGGGKGRGGQGGGGGDGGAGRRSIPNDGMAAMQDHLRAHPKQQKYCWQLNSSIGCTKPNCQHKAGHKCIVCDDANCKFYGNHL